MLVRVLLLLRNGTDISCGACNLGLSIPDGSSKVRIGREAILSNPRLRGDHIVNGRFVELFSVNSRRDNLCGSGFVVIESGSWNEIDTLY